MSQSDIVKVVFSHDNEFKKWTIKVENAVDSTEALQAFTAVIISCKQLQSVLLSYTQIKPLPLEDHIFEVVPAVFQQ